MRAKTCGRRAAITVLSLCLTGSTVAKEEAVRLPDTGVETTRVTLMLLDVSVIDGAGNPIRGLKAGDFTVHLDRKPWPVYSVDDLCTEAVDPIPIRHNPRAVLVDRAAPPAAHAEGDAAIDGPRFVIYLDFSQLQTNGRARAIAEARRWIANTMRPGDRVMLAAYSTPAGARTLSGFTEDRDRLLSALDAVEQDLAFVDPFPSLRASRQMDHPDLMTSNAWSEFEHGRRSASALRNLLEDLELMPGPKTLLLLHQNSSLHPGIFYGRDEKQGALMQVNNDPSTGYMDDPWRRKFIEDHETRIAQVGAVASRARVAVYAGNVGGGGEAIAYGAVLAAASGGRYNAGLGDLAALMDEARVRASCRYRIGLLPPDARGDRDYPVRVFLKGKVLEDEMRVTHLSESSRWMQRARSVLSRPGAARALPVSAAIVPLRAEGMHWIVRLRVAVALDAIQMLPSADARHGRWEVGALLSRDDDQAWEMLGHSEIRIPPAGRLGVHAVHEQDLGRLPPGEYRLAAFVRDRSLDEFGGAEAMLSLPDPRAGGIVGPILQRADRRILPMPLPLKSSVPENRADGSAVVRGPVPLESGPVVDPGEALQASLWLCSAAGVPAGGAPLRFLSVNGVPVARFDRVVAAPAGDCVRWDDEFVADRPGRLTYHAREGAGDGPGHEAPAAWVRAVEGPVADRAANPDPVYGTTVKAP